jgi:hypothetical protein
MAEHPRAQRAHCVATLDTLASLQKDDELPSNHVVKLESDAKSTPRANSCSKILKEEHSAEIAALKGQHAKLANVNHNLNDGSKLPRNRPNNKWSSKLPK